MSVGNRTNFASISNRKMRQILNKGPNGSEPKTQPKSYGTRGGRSNKIPNFQWKVHLGFNCQLMPVRLFQKTQTFRRNFNLELTENNTKNWHNVQTTNFYKKSKIINFFKQKRQPSSPKKCERCGKENAFPNTQKKKQFSSLRCATGFDTWQKTKYTQGCLAQNRFWIFEFFWFCKQF